MTSIELLFFFLIFASISARSIAYKILSKHCSSSVFPLMGTIWYLIGIVILYPFYQDLLTLDKILQPVVILSVIKGIVVWIIFDLQQKVTKQSLSSSVFYMPIGLGLAAVINIFFKENLSHTAWLSIIALMILGALFFIFGHAKELDKKHKLYFIGMILCFIYFVVSNHIVIYATNWYVHFTIIGLSMFSFLLLKRPKKSDLQKTFSPPALIVGLVFLAAEIILTYSTVTIMPASTTSLASSLSVPFVMVISAFIYKEGGWKEQLLFGGLAYIFCIPLLLGW